MNFIAAITWNVSPEIFSIGPFSIGSFQLGPLTIRWYGLLFALGFIVGQNILIKIFKKEGKDEKDVETITMYMVAGTVLGARLGHCLFYAPDHYLSNPIEILKVWEGGLASHGAAIGIFLSIWLYSRKNATQSYLWLLDRIAITVALAGCFIRFGNLMNSEIIGKVTTLPWGFIFENNYTAGPDPRHPAQLYESISCLIIFFFIYWVYNKTKEKTPDGKIFALFLIFVFGLRFLYEFIKKNQEAFEDGMLLNMGQILSIPLVITGIYLYQRSKKLEKIPAK